MSYTCSLVDSFLLLLYYLVPSSLWMRSRSLGAYLRSRSRFSSLDKLRLSSLAAWLACICPSKLVGLFSIPAVKVLFGVLVPSLFGETGCEAFFGESKFETGAVKFLRLD